MSCMLKAAVPNASMVKNLRALPLLMKAFQASLKTGTGSSFNAAARTGSRASCFQRATAFNTSVKTAWP